MCIEAALVGQARPERPDYIAEMALRAAFSTSAEGLRGGQESSQRDLEHAQSSQESILYIEGSHSHRVRHNVPSTPSIAFGFLPAHPSRGFSRHLLESTRTREVGAARVKLLGPLSTVIMSTLADGQHHRLDVGPS